MKEKLEEAEKHLHRMEREQPEKVKKVRENLRAIGYSDEEIMKIVPQMSQGVIDQLNMFEPKFMKDFEPGDFGVDKLLGDNKERE